MEGVPVPCANFVDKELLAKLQCVICNNLLTNAQQTKCGHKMCLHCLTNILGTHDEIPCPVKERKCRVITKTNYKPDYSVKKKIAGLRITCVYKSFGCSAYVLLPELPNHLQDNILFHNKLLIAKANSMERIIDNTILDNKIKQLCTEMEKINQRITACRPLPIVQTDIYDNLGSDSTFIWKVYNYTETKRKRLSIFSNPFYTKAFGYKLCLHLYLNGVNKNKFISLFLNIMQGDNDDNIPWPFAHKIKMILLAQKNKDKDIVNVWQPDLTSCCFQKPTNIINIGSGCTEFAEHKVIEDDDTYIVNDAFHLKIIVLPLEEIEEYPVSLAELPENSSLMENLPPVLS